MIGGEDMVREMSENQDRFKKKYGCISIKALSYPLKILLMRKYR